MLPVNTPSKHETLTPRVCWAADLAVQTDTDTMAIKCWASVAVADQ